ncbi:MAG: MBL fold metallo-hydrolase, partial [Planctomycetes bacterium]|nr:MBL fold metallo-hydrolase [Planctomycetota bacterium]
MTEKAPFPFDSHPSRRRFLKTAAVSTAALALGRTPDMSSLGTEPAMTTGTITQLSEHLSVYHGSIQVGILRDGEKSLLIDCGDGDVAGVLAGLGIKKVEQILFTHHHRDQACGAYALAESGSRICVPEAEKDLFANPADYWNNDVNIWRVYRSFRPQPLTLTEPLRVDRVLGDGQEIVFGPATIRVVSTPGHTNGSVSYVVDVDDQLTVFSGDLIYDAGQVWDVYSLQRGFSRGERSIGGYHGFMGDQWRLKESLARLKQLQPLVIVPSHGRMLREPARAVDALVERIDACYENYVSISALRHYFPELFTDYEGRPGQMPIRPGLPVPECLRHFGTTWMLIADDGAALVMDVGSTGMVTRLQQMLDRGEIGSIDALWVTHYHFDHTDGIPQFQQTFDCPCYTDRRLADVITRPRAWRLPCLAAESVRVDHPLEDGHSWQWHEFKLTSFYYPGQTMYHAALLAERDDLRMLFVGDSHTMSGNDDYCAHNR